MLFISYSTQATGKNFAGKLKHELQEALFPCFLAHEDIQVSEDWVRIILERLRTCAAFLGVIDKGFNASAYCQQELGAALALDKPMLLISRDGATHPPCLAHWIQSGKPRGVLRALRTQVRFQPLRTAAYIHGVESAENFASANAVQAAFAPEWGDMDDTHKLMWLKAAASNGQVYGEKSKIGPFFEEKCEELRKYMKPEWLRVNDVDQQIHRVLRQSRRDEPSPPDERRLSRREDLWALA